jgi:uridine kinase
MREEWTPQSYYDEGYDYLAFCDLLLRPLGAGGDHRVRTAIFDSFHDVPVPEQWQVAPESTILIVHGANLQRPELRSHWDYLIWLKVDANTAEMQGPHDGEASRQVHASRDGDRANRSSEHQH